MHELMYDNSIKVVAFGKNAGKDMIMRKLLSMLCVLALLLSLAARPLAQPPFPLGCLEQLLRAQAQLNLQNGTEDAKPSTGKVQKN